MPKLLRYHSRIAEDLDFENSYGNGYIMEDIETEGLFYYFYGEEYYYAIICSDMDENYGFDDIKRIRYEIEIQQETFTKEIGCLSENKDKILILNKFENYAAFFWIFCNNGKVDYDHVKKFYGGIEFRNVEKLHDIIYIKNIRNVFEKSFWIKGTDNGGGIIWNLSLVQKFIKKSEGVNAYEANDYES